MFTRAHEDLAKLSTTGRCRPELEAAVQELGRLEAHAVERRLAFLCAIEDLADGGVPADAVNRSRTRSSKRASRKAAKTATKLKDMPETRKALAQGEITEEHANAAAQAAEETSPEEADAALIRKAKAQPADLFGKKAREWAESRQTEDEKRSRHERQRSKREARIWTDADGMTQLRAAFDPVLGRDIRNALGETYDRLWRSDGGREGSPSTIRSDDQRRADALAEILTGRANGSAKRPHPKYTAVVNVDYDRLHGSLVGAATFADGEPLPDSVLERILCDGALVGAIYGAAGAVMWQGRSTRLATDDQWTQLVARDGGCVGCGASPAHCEAHHIDYWENLGLSDIDNFVLVCPTDHHLIHNGSHVLVTDADGWKLVRKSAQRRSHAEAA